MTLPRGSKLVLPPQRKGLGLYLHLWHLCSDSDCAKILSPVYARCVSPLHGCVSACACLDLFTQIAHTICLKISLKLAKHLSTGSVCSFVHQYFRTHRGGKNKKQNRQFLNSWIHIVTPLRCSQRQKVSGHLLHMGVVQLLSITIAYSTGDGGLNFSCCKIRRPQLDHPDLSYLLLFMNALELVI